MCTSPKCALLSCLWVCEWGSQLALREEQGGEPYSLDPSRKICTWSIKHGAHKEMGGGIRAIIAAKGQVHHRLSGPLLRQIA